MNQSRRNHIAFMKLMDLELASWQQEVLLAIENGERFGSIDRRALQKAEQRHWFERYQNMQKGEQCPNG